MAATAILPLQFRIPLRGLKFSTNKIYAGTHWSKRKSVKDGILGYARIFCRPIHEIGSYPVEIHYRFFFKSRPLDTLNCAAMAKMFEDSLCTLGFLKDDDPKHVARSVLEVVGINRPKGSKAPHDAQPKGDAQNEDYLEIKIIPYAPCT